MIKQMTRSFLGALGFASLLAAMSCSQARDSNKFATAAAQGGMAEVEMGRLAEQRGSDPAVKQFGARMTADHGRADAELKAIAEKKGIQLPNDLNASQRSELDKLAKLSGADFDKEYMSTMLRDHESDVKDFETQAKQGGDPEIKAFADKTLPVLKQHLQMAQSTAKKVGVS